METTLFRQDPDSWLSSDIAIEVIGHMVAEQMSLIHALLNEYRAAGIESDDDRVLNDARYQQYGQRLTGFQQEIQSIYRGQNKAEIFDRVDRVYAPYIKEKHTKSVLQ